MKNPAAYSRLSTEMDYRKRINQAMVFIQNNLDRDLSIDDVADSASFSSFHFHRIFKAFVGETIGDYMNRVKMVRAASLMTQGLNTADAAKSIGYQTASAFSKAFKKTFGTLPSAFKQQEVNEIKYIPRPGVANKGGIVPEFRDMPELELWIIHKKGKLNENFTKVAGESFDELHKRLEKIRMNANNLKHLGILKDFDLVNSKDCRYDACVVITDKASRLPPKSVDTGYIRKGRWAVFLHKGPYDTLWQTWNRIYNSWYPLSGVELRDADPFEVYLYDRRVTDPSDLITEIHVPVVSKEGKEHGA